MVIVNSNNATTGGAAIVLGAAADALVRSQSFMRMN
jgi:hypothetical protein